MKELLIRLEEKYNATLDVKESRWYNGHAYLPLIDYSLSFWIEESYFIRFKYEHRQSEFSTSTIIDGGAFGDRHIFEIVAIYKGKKIPSFEVTSQGWFSLIFSKTSGFRVKCKNDFLKKKLLQSIELKEVFRIGTEDAEFDPLITGKDDIIKMLFNTKKNSPELIERMFDFLVVFKTYLDEI